MTYIQMIITVICTLLASSGFWAYMTKKLDDHSIENEMLIGLAHDRIMELGMKYIDRGYITSDEYENLCYLYKPYEKLGGNGSAKRIMKEVNKLELRKSKYS